MNIESTLVLATPISGPALMCIPQSVSREMALPTVLVIPSNSAPRDLQYRSAFSVSAVSPETKKYLAKSVTELLDCCKIACV